MKRYVVLIPNAPVNFRAGIAFDSVDDPERLVVQIKAIIRAWSQEGDFAKHLIDLGDQEPDFVVQV